MSTDSVIKVDYKGRIATITIDNEKKLNALSQPQYYELSQKLREVAAHSEVYITVLLAKGRFFSAYGCLTSPLLPPSPPTTAVSPLIPARDIYILT